MSTKHKYCLMCHDEFVAPSTLKWCSGCDYTIVKLREVQASDPEQFATFLEKVTIIALKHNAVEGFKQLLISQVRPKAQQKRLKAKVVACR